MQLRRLLNNYRNRITATIFCHHQGTDKTLPVLQQSVPLTISILNHIVSQKNEKATNIQKQYEHLHQVSRLELKTLTIILRYSQNLKTIVEKVERKKKYGKNQRKAFKRKQTKLAAQKFPIKQVVIFNSKFLHNIK